MNLFHYRGGLKSLAGLVALQALKIHVDAVIFSGSAESEESIPAVNTWLETNGLPTIDALPKYDAKTEVVEPIAEIGWGKEECLVAVRLSGLPIPQDTKIFN